MAGEDVETQDRFGGGCGGREESEGGDGGEKHCEYGVVMFVVGGIGVAE